MGPHVGQQLRFQLRTGGAQHPVGPHDEPFRRLGLSHHHEDPHARSLLAEY
jgi:hypothetical protein